MAFTSNERTLNLKAVTHRSIILELRRVVSPRGVCHARFSWLFIYALARIIQQDQEIAITMRSTAEDLQAILNDQMMQMIGPQIGVLVTGILLALGASSLFLLSSNGDNNLSVRNRFLRAYIVILLLAVLALDAEAFVMGNNVAIFFSRPQIELQELRVIWGQVVGSTTLLIGLLSDGLLVRSSCHPSFVRPFKRASPLRSGGVFWFKRPLGPIIHPSGETCYGPSQLVYGF